LFDKSKLKYFGLGLGLRSELRRSTFDYLDENARQTLIEWLEIVPENHIYRGGLPAKHFKEAVNREIPLIPHSANLSIGSAPRKLGEIEFDMFLLNQLKKLNQEIKAPWFSDHLSVTRIRGKYFQELLPVPLTKLSMKIVADNIKFYQDQFQIPFLVENPSYYLYYPENEMREYQYLNELCELADCGLLLDLNNVYVNSVNHRYRAKDFISEINLDKVVQVHLAGHKKKYKSRYTDTEIKLLDTRANNVHPTVMELFKTVFNKTRIKAVSLERDGNFNFTEIVEELKQIRKIMDDKYDAKQNENQQINEFCILLDQIARIEIIENSSADHLR
jgi:uncharacterized protein (UPF0276 family)